MISLFCWRSEQKKGAWLDAASLRSLVGQLQSKSDIYWIDLENPTPDEENFVFKELFSVHGLTLEDITRQRRSPQGEPHFPKVEEFPDYLLVIVNPLSQAFVDSLSPKPGEHAIANGVLHGNAGAAASPGDAAMNGATRLPAKCAVTQLSAVLTHKVLITHHRDPVPGIQELRHFLTKHEDQSERGPDFLFHLVLDAMVDQFAPALDAIHRQLDRIEDAVLSRPTPNLLRRLIKLKRGITTLRKSLIYEREITSRLARGEFSWIDEREMVYYRNVYDHVVRFAELIDSAREMASDLMQTQLAAQSNKLNETMKVLTVISCLILPMTLIAGIYGMNFADMPELKQWWGYPMALVLMVITGIVGFSFFRWRKWV